MLSEKIVSFAKNKGWWYDNIDENYANALRKMNFDLSCDFAKFYLHVDDGPTFCSRNREIYQICWFHINSNYNLDIKGTIEALSIAVNYFPLDSFSEEYGYFYNKDSEEVFGIGLGDDLRRFQEGKFTPQWKDFKSFIEWFFDL